MKPYQKTKKTYFKINTVFFVYLIDFRLNCQQKKQTNQLLSDYLYLLLFIWKKNLNIYKFETLTSLFVAVSVCFAKIQARFLFLLTFLVVYKIIFFLYLKINKRINIKLTKTIKQLEL